MTNAPQQVYVTYQPRPSTNGLAVAGVVLGAIALVGSLVPLAGFFLAFLPALLAIIFGHVAHGASRQLGGLRRTEAITSWVLGYVVLILPGVIFFGMVIIGSVANGNS